MEEPIPSLFTAAERATEQSVEHLREQFNAKVQTTDMLMRAQRQQSVVEATRLTTRADSETDARTALVERQDAVELLRNSAIQLQNYVMQRDAELRSRRALYAKYVQFARLLHQQQPPAPPQASQSLPASSSSSSLPPANDANFAELLQQSHPEWELPAPSTTVDPHACDSTGAVEIAPYQRLIEAWANPARTDHGLGVWWAAGTGKTLAGWLAILTQVQAAVHKLHMIVVPNDNIVTVWMKELSPLCAKLGMPCPALEGNSGATQVLKFANGVHVWFQVMTRVLSDSLRKHPELQPSPAPYVLPNSYNHVAYASLSPTHRARVERELADQTAAVMQTPVAVPKGLIVIDEVQNLLNPVETALDIRGSTTALAWENAIRAAGHPSRVLPLTATPAIEDNRPQDFFHYLHLLRPHAVIPNTTLAFEGVVRRARPASHDTDPALTAAITAAERLETQYTYDQLFAPDGNWLPGKQDAFERAYSALLSRVTLENDPSRYPQVAETQPVFRLSASGSALEQTQVVAPLGTVVLVELGREAAKAYMHAVKQDMNPRAFEDRRLRRADCTTPSAACIDYGASNAASGVQKGFGMKDYKHESPRKLLALMLMLKSKSDARHFIFSSAKTYREYGRALVPFLKTQRYGVWGMLDVWDFLNKQQSGLRKTKIQDDSAVRPFVDAWYKQHQPGERVVFFGNSTTQAALTQALGENSAIARDWIRRFMLGIYNDARNAGGRYVRAFVGDRRAKEGISLLQTVMVHLLEPSPNRTMYIQSTARARRNCAYRGLPPETLLNVVFYVSTLPVATNANANANARKRKAGDDHRDRAVPKTNDEYQYERIATGKWPIDQLIDALFAAAVDCRLFRAYNGDVSRCLGQPEPEPEPEPEPKLQPESEATLEQPLVGVKGEDLVCGTAERARVQLADRDARIEWTPDGVTATVDPLECAKAVPLPRAGQSDVLLYAGLQWLLSSEAGVAQYLPSSARNRIALGMLVQPQLDHLVWLAPADRFALGLVWKDRSERIDPQQQIAWQRDPMFIAWRFRAVVDLLRPVLEQAFASSFP